MDAENIIIQCSNCGTKNRIPESRLNAGPICGKCKTPLYPGSQTGTPVDVSDQTFGSEVLSYKGPALVDCWAPWCGPCKMIAPILDQLASNYAGQIKITKLNVDDNPMTASRYGIQSIPTMLLFKNGNQVDKIVGAVPKQEIEQWIQTVL
jgi:thioredoxin 2